MHQQSFVHLWAWVGVHQHLRQLQVDVFLWTNIFEIFPYFEYLQIRRLHEDERWVFRPLERLHKILACGRIFALVYLATFVIFTIALIAMIAWGEAHIEEEE